MAVLAIDYQRRVAGAARNSGTIEEVQQTPLFWYWQVQRMQEKRIPKQVLERIPTECRKREKVKNSVNEWNSLSHVRETFTTSILTGTETSKVL